VLGVTGPEEVMPGASFQVVVNNPTGQAINTTVSVDTSVLDITMPGGESGLFSVSVPARGRKSVFLRAKPEVTLNDTAVSMDGGEPLRLRVRNPNTLEPADNVDPTQQEMPQQPMMLNPNDMPALTNER
jgi:general secretion pathway protein D